MNPIVFECPLCRTPFQATPAMAGAAVQCPNCRGAIQLPAAKLAPSLPAATTSKPEPFASNPVVPSPLNPGSPAPGPLASGSSNPTRLESTAAVSASVAPTFLSPPSISEPEASEGEIESCDCPKCKRAFGFTPAMVGITVACPHCADRFVLDPEALQKPAGEIPAAAQLGLPPESHRTRFRGYRPPKPGGISLPPPAPRVKPISGPAAEDLAVTVSATGPDLPIGLAPPSEVVETQVLDPAALHENHPHESGEIRVVQQNAKSQPADLALLLPPKFHSSDPSMIRQRTAHDDPFVLLPTGDGGYQRVNTAVVRIEHDGKTILLAAPDPKRLRRRRMAVNLITILICIVILFFAFRWLLS